MRRERAGVLLPGILFTVLACLGVVSIVASATGVLPEDVPILRSAGGGPRRSTTVVTPTPSRTPVAPSPTRAASPTPAATRVPSSRPTYSSGPVTRPVAPPPPAPRCTAGSATVGAVADSYVDQSSPKTAFGRERTLLVTSRDKGRNLRALVRFTAPVVPKGCTVRGVTLTMTAREATGRRLVASPASRGWSESSVTWANAPAPSGAAVVATVRSARVVWSFTAVPANGFVIRDAAENAKGAGEQTGLGARDGKGAPTLTVRWS